MTATYWEIGRRIVESEQQGRRRAGYGEALLKNLAFDLTAQFGRGFGLANLKNIRKFYLRWPLGGSIGQTASDLSASERIGPSSDEKGQTLSGLSKEGQGLARLRQLAGRFPLPWSHSVRLLAVANGEARNFYQTEALRCGWFSRLRARLWRGRTSASLVEALSSSSTGWSGGAVQCWKFIAEANLPWAKIRPS
jgi:hypothetical protein